MDPSDRLWAELIFPHCDPTTLLALRAVCRALLQQLLVAPARLWLPLTAHDHRMSYHERLLGWRGVQRAISRERTTRANCDAGRFSRSVRIDLPFAQHVMYVGGRVATFSFEEACVFDASTGAQLAQFEVDRTFSALLGDAVLDRWIVFATYEKVLLLDCVAARLVDLATESADDVQFSIAGPCVSCHSADGVRVWHVSDGGPDGSTALREVARLHAHQMSSHDRFHLCERGASYLHFIYRKTRVRLVDLTSGKVKRVFNPRQPVADCQFYAHCDYFVARLSAGRNACAVFRISGQTARVRPMCEPC